MNLATVGSPLFAAELAVWLTPPWLIAFGALVGLVVLAAGFGIVRLASRSVAETIVASLREGFVMPILGLAAALAVFGLVGIPMVPLGDFVQSLGRLTSAGEASGAEAIAADAKDQVVELPLRPSELERIELSSAQDLVLTTAPGQAERAALREGRLELIANEPWNWFKGSGQPLPFLGDTTQVYVTNTSGVATEFGYTAGIQAEYPETVAIVGAALALVLLVSAYMAQRLVFPKVTAVATTTAKEAVAQPLFQVVLLLGAVATTFAVFIPYNTFGEDVKMVKSWGLVWITLSSALVAVWTASVSVADEIEGRTALTLLSKPIGRRQFMIGKLLGVLMPVVLMFLFLGVLFLFSVSFKVVYDSRESSQPTPSWRLCYEEMISIVPGLVLAFFESVVLGSISVAISTRLPMLPNLMLCLLVWVVGHLVPKLAQSHVNDQYGIVQFVGNFFATIFPVLEHFDSDAAVSSGNPVPLTYLAVAGVYCLLYSTVAMLVALLLFEDRDLA